MVHYRMLHRSQRWQVCVHLPQRQLRNGTNGVLHYIAKAPELEAAKLHGEENSNRNQKQKHYDAEHVIIHKIQGRIHGRNYRLHNFLLK